MSNSLADNAMQHKLPNSDIFSGKVIMRTKGFCSVLLDKGDEVMCHVKGSFFAANKPHFQLSVGDNVRVKINHPLNQGLIVEIMPRASFFQRQKSFNSAVQTIAANIDKVAFLLTVSKPDFNMNLFIRFLIAAALGNVKPVLILNKVDLIDDANLARLKKALINIPVDIYAHSIFDYKSQDALRLEFKDNMVLLIGQSGVGKSSLINHLFENWDLAVTAVNPKTGKGLHTTTLAKLYITKDAYHIIDTPGIKEFMPYIPPKLNFGAFIAGYLSIGESCRIKDCKHLTEPQCALKAKVSKGQLSEKFYEAYCKFYR